MTPNSLLAKEDSYPLRGICMIMIFFHHAFNRYTNLKFDNGGEELLNNYFSSIWHWGFLATGIFFFLSGYGLFFSIQRNYPLNNKWLYKQLKKCSFHLCFFGLYTLFSGCYGTLLSFR